MAAGSPAEPSNSLPIEALPIELPRFSEELEAAQQQVLPVSHAFIVPAPKAVQQRPQGHLRAYPTTDAPASAALLESKVGAASTF